MTAQPAKWIVDAQPVGELPAVPLADWPPEKLAALLSTLELAAFAALCAALAEAHEGEELGQAS